MMTSPRLPLPNIDTPPVVDPTYLERPEPQSWETLSHFSMPPNRSVRPSGIPNHFVVNWWKPEARGGAKPPLVRRPMTACENCRTAKVRYNGRQDCQRCTTRGLVCTYLAASPVPDRRPPPRQTVDSAHSVPTSSSAPPPPSVSSMHVTRPALAQPSPSSAGIDAIAISTTAAPPYLDGVGCRPGADLATMASADPAGIPCNHSVDQFEWGGALNPNVSVTRPTACPPGQPLALRAQDYERASGEAVGRYLQGDGDVTKHCQEIVDCTTYQVRCSDLLLIMSVLQETRPCFDHIAKSKSLSLSAAATEAGDENESPSLIKLSFGGYEVASSSASFRALLVMDLVRWAGALVARALSTSCRSRAPWPRPTLAISAACSTVSRGTSKRRSARRAGRALEV